MLVHSSQINRNQYLTKNSSSKLLDWNQKVISYILQGKLYNVYNLIGGKAKLFSLLSRILLTNVAIMLTIFILLTAALLLKGQTNV